MWRGCHKRGCHTVGLMLRARWLMELPVARPRLLPEPLLPVHLKGHKNAAHNAAIEYPQIIRRPVEPLHGHGPRQPAVPLRLRWHLDRLRAAYQHPVARRWHPSIYVSPGCPVIDGQWPHAA